MDNDGAPRRPARPAFDDRQQRTLNIIRRRTPPPAGDAPALTLGAVDRRMADAMVHQEQQYLERQLLQITRTMSGLKPEVERLSPNAPNQGALQQCWKALLQAALKAKDLDAAGKALALLNAELDIARQALAPVIPAAVVLQPPPRPMRAFRPPSVLRRKFTPAALDQLKSDVDRGFIKGTGDFGKLVDEVKGFMAVQPLAAPDAEIKRIQPMVDKVQAYLDKRPGPADGSPRKFGDDKERLKITSAESMLLEARRLQLDLIDGQFPQHGAAQPDQREQAAQGRAAAMAGAFGTRQPAGGTSDVQLVKGSAGEVAYAFKSVDGETVQLDMPKGSGAVREALASTAADMIRAQTGLDIGFPQVSLVTLGGRQGALIEGLKGQLLDSEALGKANRAQAISDEEYVATKKRWVAVAGKVPAKQLQKVVLSNLAMAQYDIKWPNLMLDEDASGAAVARPFDAGAAFPPDNVFANYMKDGGFPGAALTQNPGDGSPLASATQPMDGELVAQFLQIDRAAMKAALDAERTRLARVHGFDPGLLDDSAAQRAIGSIRIVQEILAANQAISLDDFITAYHSRMAELA